MVDTTIDLQTIPLTALRNKSRKELAIYLDAEKILPTSDGLERDWRGIFHLSQLTHEKYAFVESKSSPTMEMINFLGNVTFAEYRKMLGDIDRWDVLDDTHESFVEDAVIYLKQQERNNRSQHLQSEFSNSDTSLYEHCLTVDDVRLAEQNLPLQRYHAFILFDDKDIDFATEMIEKLEGCGFKLCVKERDFLAGLTFEHAAIRHLLTERCDRLVVILSPDFVQSPLNEYISNLAQSLGISKRTRKIIPCLYSPCSLPKIFEHIHLLDYHRSQKFFNFYDKLILSLQTTKEEREASQCPQITVTDADRTSVTSVYSVSDDLQESTNFSSRQPSTSQQSMEIESQAASISMSSAPIDVRPIYPPSPKLRSSASMVNISELDLAEMNNNTTGGDRSKKLKWYNRWSLKSSGSESNLDKKKSKSKSKNLFRRKKSGEHS